MTFITLLAWIFGVLFSIIFGLRFVGATLNQFSKTYQAQQMAAIINGTIQGYVITWPVCNCLKRCWAWIITQ